jgi:hypothetical protein
MPQQKMFQADPTNPDEVGFLFDMARNLVLDGWGATVRANESVAAMTTNAPTNIINVYFRQQATA